MSERSGERGMVTVLFEDGGRYTFDARHTVNWILQALMIPATTVFLNLLESGEVLISFGPGGISPHLPSLGRGGRLREHTAART